MDDDEEEEIAWLFLVAVDGVDGVVVVVVSEVADEVATAAVVAAVAAADWVAVTGQAGSILFVDTSML